jgi:hypothetical protein
MIETLYKTETPVKGKSECYVLVLTSRVGSRRSYYAFMEEHGYWNDQMKRFVHEVSSINTEDGITYENARAQYESAKWDLTQKGFVHSFVQEYRRKDPREYTVPELEPMTV